jgi:hypothetical protein
VTATGDWVDGEAEDLMTEETMLRDVCAEGTANSHYAPREEDVFPTANDHNFKY